MYFTIAFNQMELIKVDEIMVKYQKKLDIHRDVKSPWFSLGSCKQPEN